MLVKNDLKPLKTSLLSTNLQIRMYHWPAGLTLVSCPTRLILTKTTKKCCTAMCYFPGSCPGNAQLRRLRSSQSRAAYHSSNISATKVSPSIISWHSKNTAKGICLKTGSRDMSSSTEISFCPGNGKKGSNHLKSPLI